MIPGATAIGDGDYFYSFDIGYTRVIMRKFFYFRGGIHWKRKHYQNFRDDNLLQAGIIEFMKTISEVGGGGISHFIISVEILAYLPVTIPLREGTFGLELRFFHEKQY